MKQKKPVQMHPILRAQIRQKWESESINALIHALTGNNKDKLLAYGSIMMFVASACAAYTGISEDSIKFRVIRGAINALDDLKERPLITSVDRGSIYSGLIASQELIKGSPVEVVNDAANMYKLMEQQLGMTAS
jgi:hypothetical protein